MRRIALLHAALLAGSVGAALVACGGKVDAGKDGNGSDKLQSIDPTNVSGAVGACPAGYQHPNVCCSGGPNEASQCGAYVQHPFRACDSGWSTHPNPLTCCSLTDESCIDAPSGSVDPAPPTCGFACPPGWWPAESGSSGGTNASGPGTPPVPTPVDAGIGPGTPDEPPPGPSGGSGGGGTSTGGSGPSACCQYQGNDSVICVGVATVATPAPSAQSCAVGWDADAGVEVDAGCTTPPDPYPPSPTPPPCASACPDGWTPDPSIPASCCRANPYGARECFVNGPPPPADAGTGDPEPGPEPTDAGVGPWPTGVSCAGAQGGGCSCQGSNDGHTYDITCDDSSGCACLVDGVEVKRLSSEAGSCAIAKTRVDLLWQACGFN